MKVNEIEKYICRSIRKRITIMIYLKVKGEVLKDGRGWCEDKCDKCDMHCGWCLITPFCRNVTVLFHRHESTLCNETADPYSNITLTSNQSCVNWHQYYTDCKAGVKNPFQGAISFDNIGLAWVAIFQVSIFHYVIVSVWDIRCFDIKYFPFLFFNFKTPVVRIKLRSIFLNFELTNEQ